MKELTYPIGSVVRFADRYRPTQPQRVGKVIGHDPEPPRSSKRNGPCYVIHVEGETFIREENEVQQPRPGAPTERDLAHDLADQGFIPVFVKPASETDTVKESAFVWCPVCGIRHILPECEPSE